MKLSLKQYLRFLEEATKEEEENATKSHLQTGKHHGIEVRVHPHASSQAYLRREDLHHEHWNEILSNSVKHLKNKKAGHYLSYSKKHQQGVVSEWMPHHKRLEVMTVLPKGKSHANNGTQKHFVESVILI